MTYPVKITPLMLKRGNHALREWLADGRSEGATPDAAINIAIIEIVSAVLSTKLAIEPSR